MKNFQLLKFLFSLVVTLSLLSNLNAQTRKPQPKQTSTKPEASYQVQLKYSLYFDVNQAKIKPEGYKVLDSVVDMLRSQTNIRRIQVNGFADTTGGADANLELSNKRTDTVSNYITGKNLMQLKAKFASAFFGEKITGKETDLAEMRRVDIVLYLAKPDRDTLIRFGPCMTASIKANTFENYNNDELTFTLEYVGDAADMKKYNLSNLDVDGNELLSAAMFRLTAKYKGKPIKNILPINVQIPATNSFAGYNLYSGIEEKGKSVVWKKTDDNAFTASASKGTESEDCKTISVALRTINQFWNFDQPLPCNYCSKDPFGGLETPDSYDPYSKFGKDKSIVILNDACFKKVDATKAYFTLEDDLYPETFLNFCNSFLLPGVGNIPAIPKYETELVKFIDFNVSMKNDTADMIMVKKNKVIIMIPKSKFPAHEGKQYAILPAETKKDNYLDWTNKLVLNDACQGLVNCDYWVFEVPFTGFYSLLEVTPVDRKSRGKGESVDDDSESGKSAPNVKVKSKKFNNVMLVYGLQSENTAQTAKFLKNKGKHSFNEPKITKKEKKQYRDHVFMAYVIKDGKRYAWIGKGSELKSNIFTGNWKTPKLVYVPDEEWEEFVKKACE